MAWKLHHFLTIDSTNSHAKRVLQDGQASSGDVFYADIQTSSYGRRGRNWQSPKGNLYATLLIEKPNQLAQIPFVFGLSLFEVLSKYADESQILKLKWPNDVLLNDGKLAGVLLEVEGDYLLIGFGVNLIVAPKTDQNVATLRKPIHTKDVLTAVLKRFDAYKTIWQKSGFAEIHKKWLANAHGLNKKIVARFPDGSEKIGIFKTITMDGALILETENNDLLEISTADIFFKGLNDG